MKARTRTVFALLALLAIAVLALMLLGTKPDPRAGARPASGMPGALRPTPDGHRVREVAIDLTQPPEEALEVVLGP
jgi:hypothetical protein